MEAGRQPLQVALAVLETFDQLDRLVDLLARRHGRLRQAEIGDVKDRRLRAVEHGRDRVGHVGDVLHNGRARRLQAAQQALLLDDLDVRPDVQVGREPDEQLGQDAGTAHGLGQLPVGQPLVNGHDVDGLGRVIHVPQRAENFLVGRDEKILLQQRDGGVVDDLRRLRHHTTEHRLLRLGAVKHRGRKHLSGGLRGTRAFGRFSSGSIGSGHDHGRFSERSGG